MPRSLDCPDCGEAVALPEGFSRPKIRCPACGKYAEVPRDDRPAEPEPEAPRRRAAVIAVDDDTPAVRVTPPAAPDARRRADPRDSRPEFTPDAAGGTPLLAGTQDEDDDQPYAVPGTGLARCPHCREELPLAATFCVHCGKTLAGGRKTDRVHQPMAGSFEEGLPLQRRVQIFAGMQLLNCFFMTVALYQQGASLTSFGTLFWFTFFYASQTAMQAVLVGSFRTLAVTRTAKGKATLVVQRRVAFYSLKPEKVAWRECTHLVVSGGNPAGLVEWFTCLYLLCFACPLGVGFYFVVIHPERFEVRLTDEYGSSREAVFHTTDRELAGEVAHFARDATGLRYRPV